MRCSVMAILGACLGLLATGCRKPSARSDPYCGQRTDDWCPSPPDDPCGAHHDTASCVSDARCEGRVYSGESMVACVVDARCFASNCPTVGCLSRCETLDAAHCATNKDRCELRADHTCARRYACMSPSRPASIADASVEGCSKDA